MWRIEPGPSPVARTIDVGVGVTYVAYGAGAVWAANYVDGTVSRIDPRTNEVTATIAGRRARRRWRPAPGRRGSAPRAGPRAGDAAGVGLRRARRRAAATPDVLIASDLPLQGQDGAGPRAMADAIRLVLQQHGFRAGRFTVGYRSCDDSTAQTGDFENRALRRQRQRVRARRRGSWR